MFWGDPFQGDFSMTQTLFKQACPANRQSTFSKSKFAQIISIYAVCLAKQP